MSIGQNIRTESILWFGCVLIIDPAGVSHILDFSFRNITVGTFHHCENISDISLKTVTITYWWVFVRYPKTILCQGQAGPYEEMYEIKSGKGYHAG